VKLASIQNDGKILAVIPTRGDPYNNPYSPEGGEVLIRLNPDGSIDRSFGNAYGNNPNVLTNYGYSFLLRDVSSGVQQKIAEAPFAVFQPDGKILAGGTYVANGQQTGRAGVTRRRNTFRNGILSDFDNDGCGDVSVYRPSNGIWHNLNSFNLSYTPVQWGISTDKPAPADYDGDGKSDIAVFRQGVWYFIRSTDNSVGIVSFGIAGDVPTVGDYDGDSRSDLAVFRNGTWYVSKSSDGGGIIVNWGTAGDKPVPADYDNDGKNDFAIYRDGQWWILRTGDGGYGVVNFGLSSDLPVPAAYLQ
jgi:hypothetical protein